MKIRNIEDAQEVIFKMQRIHQFRIDWILACKIAEINPTFDSLLESTIEEQIFEWFDENLFCKSYTLLHSTQKVYFVCDEKVLVEKDEFDYSKLSLGTFKFVMPKLIYNF